jgi:hypothetical protein
VERRRAILDEAVQQGFVKVTKQRTGARRHDFAYVEVLRLPHRVLTPRAGKGGLRFSSAMASDTAFGWKPHA